MALRIAVIGSGISGLAAAWLLTRRHAVTLFEANTYLGGHTHSVDVRLGGVTHPVDTGFLVFNRETYPNLVRLFDTLGIIGTKSEMSFSLSLEEPAIEWSGTRLGTLFAQPRNLLRPRFLRMLREILGGIERGAFDIHFPKRFTGLMKLLRLLRRRLAAR